MARHPSLAAWQPCSGLDAAPVIRPGSGHVTGMVQQQVKAIAKAATSGCMHGCRLDTNHSSGSGYLADRYSDPTAITEWQPYDWRVNWRGGLCYNASKVQWTERNG
jgi:hypothetical protein